MSDLRTIHPDALELARLLEPTWPSTSARLRASGVPLNESIPGAPPAAAAPDPAAAAPAAAAPGTDPAAAPAAPAIDYDRIESLLAPRFDAMEQTIDTRLPAPAAPAPPDPFADTLGPMGYDPAEQQALQGVLQPLFQNVVQQALTPIQQENQQLRDAFMRLTNELDAGEIEERYPALQNPEVYAPVAQEALQMAQRLGLQVQDAAQVPAAVIETAYLARLGRERIASETPAPGANPGLEPAGGATPPTGEPADQDIARSIVNARGERTPAASFWGA